MDKDLSYHAFSICGEGYVMTIDHDNGYQHETIIATLDSEDVAVVKYFMAHHLLMQERKMGSVRIDLRKESYHTPGLKEKLLVFSRHHGVRCIIARDVYVKYSTGKKEYEVHMSNEDYMRFLH